MFLCFFALFLATPLFAEPTVISNTTYKSGGTIILPNGTYSVGVGSGNITSMRLSQGEDFFLMSESDCKRFDDVQLCYEEKASSTTVRISLVNLSAVIKPVLSFATDTYIAGDTLPVTIWFNNTGERPATNVRLQFSIPENTSIDDADCDYNQTTLYWTGTIYPDLDESCTFTLRINGKVNKALQANVTYDTLGHAYEATSKKSTLKATIPFEYAVSPKAFLILTPGATGTIAIVINNTDKNENLSIQELKIAFDRNVKLTGVSLPNARSQTTSVTSRATIEPKAAYAGNVNFIIPYSNKTGTLTFTLEYNTTDDATLRTIEQTLTYQTTTATLTLSTRPATLTIPSLTTGSFDVIITNPNKALTYKGYSTTITAPFLDKDITTSTPYAQSRTIATVPYDFPAADKQQLTTITATVYATTADGEQITVTKTFPITITPFQKPVIDKEETTANGITTVKVYATNKHEQTITATFQEVLPQGLFTRGTTHTTIDLPSGEQTLIYQYDFTAVNDSFPATTTYSYAYGDTTIANEATTTITPPKTTATQTQEPEQADPTPVPIQNDTIAQEPAITENRTKPTLLHIIIAAVILLLIAVISMVWDTIRHLHHFGFRHKQLISQYKALLEHSNALREKEDVLKDEQSRLDRQLGLLEEHLARYEGALPQQLSNLDHRQERAAAHEAKLKELQDHLQARLKTIADKAQQATDKQQAYAAKEQALKDDDTLLQQDVQTLKDEQERLHKLLTALHEEKQAITKQIKDFKAAQQKHLDLSIALLAKQRQHAQSYHAKLSREEAQLKKEFDQLNDDLQKSAADLERAEKIYKSTRTDHSQP